MGTNNPKEYLNVQQEQNYIEVGCDAPYNFKADWSKLRVRLEDMKIDAKDASYRKSSGELKNTKKDYAYGLGWGCKGQRITAGTFNMDLTGTGFEFKEVRWHRGDGGNPNTQAKEFFPRRVANKHSGGGLSGETIRGYGGGKISAGIFPDSKFIPIQMIVDYSPVKVSRRTTSNPPPTSCLNLKRTGSITDGDYNIQTNSGKLMKIYCKFMDTPETTPLEYLTLESGEANNYAKFAGNADTQKVFNGWKH
ncbi:uncharacterized protein LOC141909258 [Tubulanus polymorphus]|uniref:uncharacterized protein LOC141909258 n=1 Tax=Tubulanus polymorphus TaxID=672921 RepID=UPI003DA1CA79